MTQNFSIPQITVTELAERLAQAKDELQLIDVREPHEVMIAYIEGFKVLSLSANTLSFLSSTISALAL